MIRTKITSSLEKSFIDANIDEYKRLDKISALLGERLSLQLLYLACACTAAALFLQNFGQKYAHPTGAAVILTFEAVFGALFSLLLGREEGFSFVRAIGFALVFLAVIISETKLSFLRKKHNKINKI